MTKWYVKTGLRNETVDAERYERDGDWVHFYDADDKQVASFVASGVTQAAPEVGGFA